MNLCVEEVKYKRQMRRDLLEYALGLRTSKLFNVFKSRYLKKKEDEKRIEYMGILSKLVLKQASFFKLKRHRYVVQCFRAM